MTEGALAGASLTLRAEAVPPAQRGRVSCSLRPIASVPQAWPVWIFSVGGNVFHRFFAGSWRLSRLAHLFWLCRLCGGSRGFFLDAVTDLAGRPRTNRGRTRWQAQTMCFSDNRIFCDVQLTPDFSGGEPLLP